MLLQPKEKKVNTLFIWSSFVYVLMHTIGDFNPKNIAQDLNRLLEGDMSVEALRK